MKKDDTRLLLLYLLKQLNNICEKNNIPYYASGGTCLGAIRHKGFIPWDDDIDVMVPRKYYHQFVTACENSLKYPVVLRTRENDPWFSSDYVLLCFADDEEGYSDLSIDVFFLDETDPKRKIKRFVQDRILFYVFCVKMYKAANVGKSRPFNLGDPFKALLIKIGAFLSNSTLDRISKKTLLAEKREGPYWINWGSCYNYKKATYPKSAFGEPQKAPFENTYVYIEQDPYTILKIIYGDKYMELPPVEKRTEHGVREIKNTKIDLLQIKKEVGLI